ncbi:cell division protein ZipA [Microbulbifer sp. SH-1]|uniref:cell division protein ZipA n=1 Tax=Microbulbifer sp. SH-1 TaxID=2681547 RepID=UPI00140753B5|nr:cell division protein ZipA [Microbulbifer sp. SH-1]QIL89459.1 cell division protein ZipA [Microbulbifer sp. SH-1]
MDNWLINLLALVLFVAVLDGARRAWLKHRDSMKVSRNLSRSMRRDLDDDNNDILSSPRVVEDAERPASRADVASPAYDRGRDNDPELGPALAESPLEYIDPEEAEKRRQISAELPGTVRVVQRRKPEDANQVNRQVQQNFYSSRKPLAGSRPDRRESDEAGDASLTRAEPGPEGRRMPEQVSLNLDEQVPVLMDSVADEAPATPEEAPREEVQPPFWQASAEPDDDLSPRDEPESVAETQRGADPLANLAEEPLSSGRREPSLDESVSLDSLHASAEEQGSHGDEPEEKPRTAKSLWASAEIKLPELKFPDLKKAVAPARETREPSQAPSKRQAGKRESAARKERPVEEVLILNIMAPAGDYFEGNDLLRALFACGMRFGDMNIFHYHTGEDGEGPVLFSLANIVVPGTFDMSAMEDFTTPGVSLFLALPAEVEALKAFNTLLTTARYIAEQLGGELKDENRSVFTAQTAEHYRQRVMEFQRRKALAKAQA